MHHANRVNGKTAYSYIGPSISIPYFLYYLYIYLCYLYYIIYCYTCVDFENKISKISSWDNVKCVDDTCMWARSIEAACVCMVRLVCTQWHHTESKEVSVYPGYR